MEEGTYPVPAGAEVGEWQRHRELQRPPCAQGTGSFRPRRSDRSWKEPQPSPTSAPPLYLCRGSHAAHGPGAPGGCPHSALWAPLGQ